VSYFIGRELLITGATGSLGNALIRHIIENKMQFKGIRVYSRDELKQSEMKERYAKYKIPIAYILGDVRDEKRLREACKGVNIVIHTAALKQVPLAEENPLEYIQTNVYGTENVMRACIDAQVQRALFISTDKAVSPVNLYGASKMCAEKIWLQAEVYTGGRDTIFSAVRYGNVIGSRGSIFSLIKNKPEGRSISVTDLTMTRFWITLKQVSKFIFDTVANAKSGTLHIPRMPSCTLELFLTAADIDRRLWNVVGIRPGEKIHECLVNEEECRRVKYSGNKYIVPQRDKDDGQYTEPLSSGNNPLWTNDVLIIKKLMEEA
jgi:UDP-N-acetylglucosamine 4,6-dehydratase